MQRFFYIFFPLTLLLFSFIPGENFKTAQANYARVKKAYEEKEKSLKDLYKEKGINFSTQQIFLRAFKQELQLELWARSTGNDKFTLIKTYPICSSSGDLGPKRRQGDGQTPEGFYHIDRFNPQSSYHLSLGVSYPNTSDKILGGPNLGGDIFIHGNCVTIGCMPLTDNLIKEVYILAVEAKNAGQSKIPIHIFPFRMTDVKLGLITDQYAEDQALLSFWNNIKSGYDYFEKNKTLPKITVEASGKYKIN